MTWSMSSELKVLGLPDLSQQSSNWWNFFEPSGYCTFSPINVFGCFCGIMAQFTLIKHKFLDVHTWSAAMHNVFVHQLPLNDLSQLELFQSHDMCCKLTYTKRWWNFWLDLVFIYFYFFSSNYYLCNSLTVLSYFSLFFLWNVFHLLNIRFFFFFFFFFFFLQGTVPGNQDGLGRVTYVHNGECFFLPYGLEDVKSDDGSLKLKAGDQVKFYIASDKRYGFIVL